MEYPNDLWHADANYNVYGNALNPALGFIQRPGTKQTYVDVFYQPRPNADKELTPEVTYAAPGGHFTSSLAVGRFWVYTPHGNGILRFSELTLGYSFKPGLTLFSLTQYNNISHNVSENAILQWNIQPARTLYVVWNHGLTLNPNLLQGTQTITGNTMLVKLAWGFY